MMMTALVSWAVWLAMPANHEIREIEVHIETSDPEVELEGTLSFPPGEGPHPAVLLLTGSGGHTRDQVISGIPMFRKLATVLNEAGLAVLRVDDRGVGGSTGPNVYDSTTAERAADALACFMYLQERLEIDPERIGLLGHSEGAMIGPMVAEENEDVAFLILLAPPTIPGSKIFVHQQNHRAVRAGAGAEQAARMKAALEKLVAYCAGDGFEEHRFQEIAGDCLRASGLPEDEVGPKRIERHYSDLRRKWYRFFFAHDPGEVLDAILDSRPSLPILSLFGADDFQVPLRANLNRLTQSLLSQEATDFTISVIPEQDHFFMVPRGGPKDVHTEIIPDVTEIIAHWVRSKVSFNR